MHFITVVGAGYVGLVNALALAETGNQVICFDNDKSKIDMLRKGIITISEVGLEETLCRNAKLGRIRFVSNEKHAFDICDLVVIAVGTPMSGNGSADISYVMSAAFCISSKINHDCLVVLKSTVPIGTSEKIEKAMLKKVEKNIWLEVASCPEFLSQGTAMNDALNPSRIVIGTKSLRARKLLDEIFSPFGSPIVHVSRESAEMIKYSSNSFLALKISYMNEMANLCEVCGANILEVSEGMKYDPRIGASFLNAGIGYGGSCLPKDTLAFSTQARKHKITLKTLNAAIQVNEKQKIRLFVRAKKYFGSLKNLNIAVLGLTFKPHTNDLRSSLSLINIQLFLDEGAQVSVYDPVAMDAFLKMSIANKVKPCFSLNETLNSAQAVFIFTEWDEFKKITPQLLLNLGVVPVVFDGRNVLKRKDMEDAGLQYFSIGQ